MKILVIGFQRSGTTLLRRLIQIHPEVKRITHEKFILISIGANKEKIRNHYEKFDIDSVNWGEKVPFYKVVRKGISPFKYCQMWNSIFNPESKIIHIVRHPIDVAFSCFSKYKNIKSIDKPLSIYNNHMIQTIKDINSLPNTLTIKYEDLISNPEMILRNIYSFCEIDPDIDFNTLMKKQPKKKYQTFDTSRMFPYKSKEFKLKFDITNLINELNINVEGVKYENN